MMLLLKHILQKFLRPAFSVSLSLVWLIVTITTYTAKVFSLHGNSLMQCHSDENNKSMVRGRYVDKNVIINKQLLILRTAWTNNGLFYY
jgi:hypothetical protein